MLERTSPIMKAIRLGFTFLGGILLLIGALWVARINANRAHAAPIPPPEGYPKLSISAKTVTPTLAGTGGETLFYVIEIRNTGAYMAENTTFSDMIPAQTTYNGDAVASVPPAPTFSNGTLVWTGTVGFDSTTLISFSVDVSPNFSGTVLNTAVISNPMIAEPVTVTAETVVTDHPILTITKSAIPTKPGANKPLTYTLQVTNLGQPATALPVTVTDEIPLNTTFRSAGADGSLAGDAVIWTRAITIDSGKSTDFTFSVDVDDVVSGTVITNAVYTVNSTETPLVSGQPYTTTIIDPIFFLSKRVNPDPPGSNRELTYTLSLLNKGSLATDLVINDGVPVSVTYVRGGSLQSGDIVQWELPSLDTDESAEFTYTVYIDDIANFSLVNDDYGVCSAEGVCQSGDVITNVVLPARFEATVTLDPIAKKPGGGGGPVTPTIVVENIGPGNAIEASAHLIFRRISVSENDLIALPPSLPQDFPSGPDCGDKCVNYFWTGDLFVGETITLTTIEGQSTIGGEEGTNYTATVVMTDSLENVVTDPITGTAIGKITHFANLIPTKFAPRVIGQGQMFTYTINVWNSALTTDTPPFPTLTDTVPASVTLVNISDGGEAVSINGNTVVSWTLPDMSTGSRLNRSYSVQVPKDLLSGTQIINDDYRTLWEDEGQGETLVLSITGKPVTTTVIEVGLVDSFKEVTPTLALPGEGNVLTYFLHIVNSSPISLENVAVYDLLPWEVSTYQRDAIASAGNVVSDIVSINWEGDIGAFSEETITFTVLVDKDYEGPVTNTATITHSELSADVVVEAVAYITTKPVLRITKSASPDPVNTGEELRYTIRVTNLGQQATNLVIQDTLPGNTSYVPDSASSGGKFESGMVTWEIPVLEPLDSTTFQFSVLVGTGNQVVNDDYWVSSSEGVVEIGEPLVTPIRRGGKGNIYLPVIMR